MAGSTSFWISVQGKGGHAAMPHLTIDPVVAGAAIVQGLQTLVSRETDPVNSVVISISRFNTGTASRFAPLSPK
jgi:IAA-amino acid hydrolase